jgi:hypothetical protein
MILNKPLENKERKIKIKLVSFTIFSKLPKMTFIYHKFFHGYFVLLSLKMVGAQEFIEKAKYYIYININPKLNNPLMCFNIFQKKLTRKISF